ncbi:substrate-binding periplasmic protein [Kordiimonas sp.]|uniref:substrate-binding periplasmic protein n=1 Tax=Kordiimonas sp. TaxID=1970157 RepID=UPI003A93C127
MKYCGLFGVILSLITGEAEAYSDLVLLTEENPPYNFAHPETGKLQGTAIDIVEVMMQDASITYTLTLMPWNRAYRETMATANTCLFVVNRTPEREPLFDWVGPLINGGWAIFRRPGSGLQINSLDDLQGHTIAGKMGSASVDTLERDANVSVVRTSKDETAARMLFHGRAELWITGMIDGPEAAKAVGLPQPELALLWKRADLSMACGKGTDPVIIAKLNKLNTARFEVDAPRSASASKTNDTHPE